ncbi:MAG: hypothetical protein KDA42_07060 [Planctomycetales bacterium]|nr:hypothetical protein [Planctomycetales bacterium]
MSDALSLEISAELNWLFEESLDLSTVTDNARLQYDQALDDGTSAGQADKLWHATRSVGAGSNDDLDLSALTQSIHGSTVTIAFAKIRAIMIVNTATTAGETLVLDSSVANAFTAAFHSSATSKLQIPADSPLMLVNKVDGWAVTDGSADILRISNAGSGTVSYKIVIAGTSA